MRRGDFSLALLPFDMGGQPAIGLQVGHHLDQIVAHGSAQRDLGQAALAQVDQVPRADFEKIGQLSFGEPLTPWNECLVVHTPTRRVNWWAARSLLRNKDLVRCERCRKTGDHPRHSVRRGHLEQGCTAMKLGHLGHLFGSPII
jgi:hypothetical protein